MILGYSDPEKHGKYIANRNIEYLDGSSIPLINLAIKNNYYSHEMLEKYLKLNKVIIPVDHDEFDLSIYFSSKPDSVKLMNYVAAKTTLGVLGFKVY